MRRSEYYIWRDVVLIGSLLSAAHIIRGRGTPGSEIAADVIAVACFLLVALTLILHVIAIVSDHDR